MLEFLFGPKNPTKDWRRDPDLRLTFDLERGTLNGVGLGDSLDRLSFLGPVEDRTGLRSGEYRYFSLGLFVGCNEGQIADYYIVQRDRFAPQYRPFAGVCCYRGEHLDLGRLTEEFFVENVGLPFWRDQDDDEILLFYEFPSREWQVEFALDGTLNVILVTGKPLMAEEEQRKAYGVDKPWPP